MLVGTVTVTGAVLDERAGARLADFAAAQAPGEDIQRLQFVGCQIAVSAFSLLAPFSSIRSLSFSGCTFTEPSPSPSLTGLNPSTSPGDAPSPLVSALESLEYVQCSSVSRSLVTIVPFLARSRLFQRLAVRKCAIGRPDCEVLSELFSSMAACRVQSLDLSGNPIETSGLLAAFPTSTVLPVSVVDLQLRNTGIGGAACERLCSVLSSYVQRLDLAENFIGWSGLESIRSRLPAWRHLVSLDISANELYVEDLTAFLQTVLNAGSQHVLSKQDLDSSDSPFPLLRQLDIAGNFRPTSAGADGLTALCAEALLSGRLRLEEFSFASLPADTFLLTHHPLRRPFSLTSVSLRNALSTCNRDRTTAALQAVFACLPQVEQLDLGANALTSDDIPAIFAFASTNSSLQRLNLSDNEFPGMPSCKIQSPSLKVLIAASCSISGAALPAFLAACLTSCVSLEEVDVLENGSVLPSLVLATLNHNANVRSILFSEGSSASVALTPGQPSGGMSAAYSLEALFAKLPLVNRFGERDVAAVRCNQLLSLEASRRNVEDVALEVSGLSYCTNLRIAAFDDRFSVLLGGDLFARSFQTHPSLSILSLSGVLMSRAGWSLFVDTVQTLKSLRELYLSGCDVIAGCSEQLAAAVGKMEHLLVLDVSRPVSSVSSSASQPTRRGNGPGMASSMTGASDRLLMFVLTCLRLRTLEVLSFQGGSLERESLIRIAKAVQDFHRNQAVPSRLRFVCGIPLQIASSEDPFRFALTDGRATSDALVLASFLVPEGLVAFSSLDFSGNVFESAPAGTALAEFLLSFARRLSVVRLALDRCIFGPNAASAFSQRVSEWTSGSRGSSAASGGLMRFRQKGAAEPGLMGGGTNGSSRSNASILCALSCAATDVSTLPICFFSGPTFVLTKLRAAEMSASSPSFSSFLKRLSILDRLEEVDVSDADHRLDEELLAKDFVEVASRLPKLSRIVFDRCRLTDGLFVNLGERLRSDRGLFFRLTSLSFCGCRLDLLSDSPRHFAAALLENGRMTALDGLEPTATSQHVFEEAEILVRCNAMRSAVRSRLSSVMADVRSVDEAELLYHLVRVDRNLDLFVSLWDAYPKFRSNSLFLFKSSRFFNHVCDVCTSGTDSWITLLNFFSRRLSTVFPPVTSAAAETLGMTRAMALQDLPQPDGTGLLHKCEIAARKFLIQVCIQTGKVGDCLQIVNSMKAPGGPPVSRSLCDWVRLRFDGFRSIGDAAVEERSGMNDPAANWTPAFSSDDWIVIEEPLVFACRKLSSALVPGILSVPLLWTRLDVDHSFDLLVKSCPGEFCSRTAAASSVAASAVQVCRILLDFEPSLPMSLLGSCFSAFEENAVGNSVLHLAAKDACAEILDHILSAVERDHRHEVGGLLMSWNSHGLIPRDLLAPIPRMKPFHDRMRALEKVLSPGGMVLNARMIFVAPDARSGKGSRSLHFLRQRLLSFWVCVDEVVSSTTGVVSMAAADESSPPTAAGPPSGGTEMLWALHMCHSKALSETIRLSGSLIHPADGLLLDIEHHAVLRAALDRCLAEVQDDASLAVPAVASSSSVSVAADKQQGQAARASSSRASLLADSPLAPHNHRDLEVLMRTAVWSLEPFSSAGFYVTDGRPFALPLFLSSMRSYFGETVGFYSAFISHFMIWLLLLLLPGSAAMCLSHSLTARTGYVVYVVLWGWFFVWIWQRKTSAISLSWGVYRAEESELVRPQFKGLGDLMRQNPVTGVLEPYFPSSKRLLRYLFSAMVTGIFVVVAIASIIVNARLEYQPLIRAQPEPHAVVDPPSLSAPASAELMPDAGWLLLDMPWMQYMLSGHGYSIFSAVLGTAYASIVEWLTDLENHRTQSDHIASSVLKNFVFTFVNVYLSAVFVVFFSFESPAMFSILAEHLLSLQSGKIITELVLEYVVPFASPRLKDLYRRYRAARADRRRRQQVGLVGQKRASERAKALAGVSRCGKEARFRAPDGGSRTVALFSFAGLFRRWWSRMAPWSTGGSGTTLEVLEQVQFERTLQAPEDDLFSEYVELISQYGFLVLFAAASPAVSLYVLANNLLEFKGDMFKFCRLNRRSFRRPTGGIGVWLPIMRFLNVSAIVTNSFFCAVLVAEKLAGSAADSVCDAVVAVAPWFSRKMVLSLAIFFPMCLLLLMLWVLFDQTTPKDATWVRYSLARQRQKALPPPGAAADRIGCPMWGR